MRAVKAKHLLLVLGVVWVSVFGGCSNQEEESPIEITLMHGWGGTLKTHNTMQQIYAEFSEKNPDIVLKCTPYSDSSIAVETANDMLAVGKMPDIINTNGLSYYVANAVKQGKAMDLMPFIQKDKQLEQRIHPSIYDTWMTEKQELYTVPDVLEVAGYWYNEEYLRKAGIDEIPTTWEAFFEMTEQVASFYAPSDGVWVCALDQTQISEYLFLARLAGENENGKQAAGDSRVALEEETVSNTMFDLAELCNVSKIVDNIENARQNFLDGKSVFYFNGVWESDALAESERIDQFSYAAYPTDSGATLAYISPSSGYVFAKQTDERKTEACIRFLKYMLSEEVQMKMTVRTGQAPSNPEIDLAQLEEGTPVFGNAIRIAYQAEVELKTIWSVWPEAKLQIVKEYSKKLEEGWSTSETIQMTEELNRNQ